MSKRSLMLSKLVVASCFLTSFFPTAAISTPTQQNAAPSDLDAEYKDKLVTLPRYSCGQKLQFGPSGTLVSGGQSGAPERCGGIRIRHVQVEDGKLIITAERVRLSLNCETGQVNEVSDGDETGQGRGVSIEVLLPDADEASVTATMQRLFRPAELGTRRIVEPTGTLAGLASGGSNSGLGDVVYHVGMGVMPPIPIFSPDPYYTERAREAKLQGTVVLVVVIGPDGLVHSARVSRSLGMGLDEKAIEGVKTWRFKPAMRCGNPVAVEVSIEIKFELYHRGPDQPSPTTHVFGDPGAGSPLLFQKRVHFAGIAL